VKPIFCLGIGAQKSGTTWLYRSLASHPNASMDAWKEFAFWDTFFMPDTSFRKRNFQERKERLLREINSAVGQTSVKKKRELKGLTLALELMASPDHYLSYFKSLASHSQVNLVGDITPSYATLSSSNLEEIRGRIEGAGFILRPIFIMRDPLSRMTSAFNMMVRRRVNQGLGWTQDGAQEQFWKFCMNKENQIRTRYERTVVSLDAAFEAQGVHYQFSETLFSQAAINDVWSFLELSSISVDTNRAINKSPMRFTPDSNTTEKFLREFSQTYDFCRYRFSAERALESWNFQR
jgi:hypothetical protein